MTRTEAAAVLGVSEAAPLAEVRKQYALLYNEFQGRVSNAPTAALRRTYQEKLQALAEARDILHPEAASVGGGDYPSSEPLIREAGGRPVAAAAHRATAPESPARGLPKSTIAASLLAIVFATGLSLLAVLWFQRKPASNRVDPSLPMGALLVLCDRDCTLIIDGTRAGTIKGGAGEVFGAAVGQHLVRAEADGAAWEQLVELKTKTQVIVRTSLNEQVAALQQARLQAEAARREAAEREAAAAEQARQAELRQQEAARQAELAQQEAARQEALRREQDQQRQMAEAAAAARFFASLQGTWARAADEEDRVSRSHVEETATIGPGCAGVLDRTVTRWERGFTGWKQVGTNSNRLTFSCDAAGRMIGQMNGAIALVNARQLRIGASTFDRR